MKTILILAALTTAARASERPALNPAMATRAAMWASAEADRACDGYLRRLRDQSAPDALLRGLKELTDFAAKHPETHGRLAEGLMDRARRAGEPASLKAVINALVDLAHLSAPSQSEKILSFLQALRQKNADVDMYDHLSWAIKQLRPESVFGEVY
jgi:hypothetical protein